MMNKRGFLFLSLAAATCFALPASARPHGHVPPPGMRWCSKCDGDGYNRTWYGYAKKCHVCNGSGLLPLAPPPPAAHRPAPPPSAGRPNPPHAVGRPNPQPSSSHAARPQANGPKPQDMRGQPQGPGKGSNNPGQPQGPGKGSAKPGKPPAR